MKVQIFQRFPILKPITIEVLEETQYSEATLEVHASFQQNSLREFDLTLVDDYIIVYSLGESSSEPLAYIKLDISLKFEKLLLPSTTPSKTQAFERRKVGGFKLIDDFGQSIDVLIHFEELALVWIKHLGKVLNQAGFSNCYKPIRTLGKGSFATVYEIIRLEDGQRFACKVFSKEIIKSNSHKMQSFLNELEILRAISHPQLLKLQGVFESELSFYVITQILNGGNLFEHLLKRRTRLSKEDVQKIMSSLLKGLLELEQNGIVHRDIKLQNLMLRQTKQIEPVIVDFGLAVYHDDEDYVYYQCGTPGYLSPQALTLKKGQTIAPKSDIFSAGAILHVLLTGKYLFEGKTPKDVFESNKSMTFDLEKPEYNEIEPQFLDLLKKMLQKSESLRLSVSECLCHPSLNSSNHEAADQKNNFSPAPTFADFVV